MVEKVENTGAIYANSGKCSHLNSLLFPYHLTGIIMPMCFQRREAPETLLLEGP